MKGVQLDVPSVIRGLEEVERSLRWFLELFKSAKKDFSKTFDITKVPDFVLRATRDPPEILEDCITLTAYLLELDKNGRPPSEEELERATKHLYIHLRLERLVRRGLLKRRDKWSWKNQENIRYVVTEELMEVLRHKQLRDRQA